MKRYLLATLPLLAALPAQAAFTNGAFFTAPSNGTLTFTFEGASAADTDVMAFTFGGATVFTNHVAPGSVVQMPVVAGQLYQVQMADLSVPHVWSSDPGLNSDGMPHLETKNAGQYAQFHLTATPPDPVSGTCAEGGDQCYLGWEDRRFPGADADYNDLVFAEIFTPASVPEPASLALLGMGLIGLGMVRRAN